MLLGKIAPASRRSLGLARRDTPTPPGFFTGQLTGGESPRALSINLAIVSGVTVSVTVSVVRATTSSHRAVAFADGTRWRFV